VSRKIEIEIMPFPNEQERQRKIKEMVSGIVYDYLKENGLLKDVPDKSAEIKNLLENTRKLTKRFNDYDNTDNTLINIDL